MYWQRLPSRSRIERARASGAASAPCHSCQRHDDRRHPNRAAHGADAVLRTNRQREPFFPTHRAQRVVGSDVEAGGGFGHHLAKSFGRRAHVDGLPAAVEDEDGGLIKNRGHHGRGGRLADGREPGRRISWSWVLGLRWAGKGRQCARATSGPEAANRARRRRDAPTRGVGKMLRSSCPAGDDAADAKWRRLKNRRFLPMRLLKAATSVVCVVAFQDDSHVPVTGLCYQSDPLPSSTIFYFLTRRRPGNSARDQRKSALARDFRAGLLSSP